MFRFAVFALLALAACGGSSERYSEPLAPGDQCIDEDGDGFGMGCAAGLDCDDNDPTVTNECYAPEKCQDGQTQPCRINLPQQGTVSSCLDGVSTCDKGAWGACVASSSKKSGHGSK